ncbi:NYN domain-containing protein [Candidatus Nitronereus thalassa]|uniref:NYN domain-containing protein n=1 Tax=Candidatus Nitronereus thalassa TaxID=3020898 RepID=A0ABU3K4C6_9BACT|nr:NYN domain-containing protein [Candidatus Nitronereus thalassa]MDT7041251.1 NYN domain-containing protein [Candidatus Nitronereus thalassa]
MAMHVIVDGYNILGVRGWSGKSSSQESEQCRERLIQDLSRYSHRKGHSLTVVFDAWRQPHGECREHRSGVQVLFTREGERADQVIQGMTRKYTRDCVVVSSDLEVVATAKAHGALTISAKEFQGKLQSAGNNGLTSGRTAKPLTSAVYGKVEEEVPLRRPNKKGNPRKLPKAQRNRNRQLRGF